jgi:hypothetical protein
LSNLHPVYRLRAVKTLTRAELYDRASLQAMIARAMSRSTVL